MYIYISENEKTNNRRNRPRDQRTNYVRNASRRPPRDISESVIDHRRFRARVARDRVRPPGDQTVSINERRRIFVRALLREIVATVFG